jgi:hypothetical protein
VRNVRVGICGRDAIVVDLAITRSITGLTARSAKLKKMRQKDREGEFAIRTPCSAGSLCEILI